ncbi:MAG: ABC transporter substrate-binding protein [Oscillospiraceae bacterium]|jgi:ABC-type glycerol-3-phosphate transport system substrate-binding protein|nr:ABC transporter substrate-binding protein [Oscillospiraceae bacterium]
MKKIIILFIAMSISLSFSSCGKAQNNAEADGETFAAPYEVMLSGIEIGEVYSFERFEDKIILIGGGIGDTGATTVKVLTFDSEGVLTGDTILVNPDDEDEYTLNWTSFAVDSRGNIWMSAEKRERAVGPESTEASLNKESCLYCFGGDGGILKTIRLDNVTLGNYPLSNANSKMFVGNDGRFYIYGYDFFERYLIILDENGNMLCEINDPNIKNILKLPDGQVCAGVERNTGDGFGMEIVEINAEKGGYGGREYYYPVSDSSTVFVGGNDVFDLLECNADGVYGHNTENKTREELLNWTERGINGRERYQSGLLDGITLFGDRYVYALLYEYSGNSSAANRITRDTKTTLIKINAAEKPADTHTKTITAAALYDDDVLEQMIWNFNLAGGEYKTELKTYAADASGDALTLFNLDVLAGNMPDVVFFSKDAPFKSYASKGLFADLYELFDKDPDTDKGDYLPNILKIFETNGGLYAFAPSFNVQTVIGKASDVGNKPGWTWKEYFSLISGRPEGTIPIANDFYIPTTREWAFRLAVRMRIFDFVDYEKGKCYFTGDDFTGLFRIADAYPPGGNGIETFDLKNGNPLLLYSALSGFGDASTTRYEALFGDEITYIGYPADGKSNGSAADFWTPFSISSNAAEKDGAWSFIKYLLTDYQDTAGDNSFGTLAGFPVKITALDGYIQKVLDDYQPNDFYRQPEEKDYRKIVELISEITVSYEWEPRLSAIIEEESAYYFAGQKTTDEVTAVIQNRVSLYLAETG